MECPKGDLTDLLHAINFSEGSADIVPPSLDYNELETVAERLNEPLQDVQADTERHRAVVQKYVGDNPKVFYGKLKDHILGCTHCSAGYRAYVVQDAAMIASLRGQNAESSAERIRETDAALLSIYPYLRR